MSPWHRKLRVVIITAVMIMIAVAFLEWLDSYRPSAPELTAHDLQVAAGSIELVEQRLSSMGSEHELVRRYGRFQSLTVVEKQKHRPSRGGFASLYRGPSMHISCVCQFEKYPERINVTIIPDNQITQPRVAIFMNPVEEFRMDVGEYEPKVIDGELWFYRTDGSASHSMVEFQVNSPQWKPEF